MFSRKQLTGCIDQVDRGDLQDVWVDTECPMTVPSPRVPVPVQTSVQCPPDSIVAQVTSYTLQCQSYDLLNIGSPLTVSAASIMYPNYLRHLRRGHSCYFI